MKEKNHTNNILPVFVITIYWFNWFITSAFIQIICVSFQGVITKVAVMTNGHMGIAHKTKIFSMCYPPEKKIC